MCILLTLNVMLFAHNDVTFFHKIWMNAPTGHTCAANMRTARTPWAPIAASVKKATRVMASLVQVGSCWEQLWKWQSEKPGVGPSFRLFVLQAHYSQLLTEKIRYLKQHPRGMEIWSQVS